MEIIRTPTEGYGIPQYVNRVCGLPNEVNSRRGEPALRRIGVNQSVDLCEQVTINIVLPPRSGIGRLDEMFYRSVGDHTVESPVPLAWYRAVVEKVDVEHLLAAVPHLFGGNGDPDPRGVAQPDSLQERPVTTTEVQYAPAWSASDLIQQVVELISLGLFIRCLGITVINPLRQVEQPAGWKEPIKGRVAGDDRFPRLNIRCARISRWLRVCNSHVAPDLNY